MLVVGLTGGIGSGKSTVSDRLKNHHHITIVDADLIAREVVYPGKNAYNRIINVFGPHIPNLLKPDNTLNREALGQYVFGDRTRLSQLNGIVHPAVKWEIGRQIIVAYLSFMKLVVLDVPLLFESGLHLICGKVITVTCEKDIQIQRLAKRNPDLSEEDVRKRIDSQMSNDKRCFMSDLIIDNNSSLTELHNHIDSVVEEMAPNMLFTILDLFPPFGIMSAFLTVTIRYFVYRFKDPKKID